MNVESATRCSEGPRAAGPRELSSTRAGPAGSASAADARQSGHLAQVAKKEAGDAGRQARDAKRARRRTLRAKGGFRARAPRGYKLRVRSGAYIITGKAARMTLLAVRSDDSARTVAETLLGAGLPPTPNADQFGLLLSLKRGRLAEIYFSKVASRVVVAALSPRGKRRKRISRRERRRLGSIARSARRMRSRNLPRTTTREQEPPLALRPFTNADGSARASVPDGPGWGAAGQQGVVEGGHADLGSFAFGVTVPFLRPGAFCFAPCPLLRSPFLGARDAVEQAWPQFLNAAGASISGMQVVSQVPGSAGVLGPGFDSGMFGVSFANAGRPGVGYIMAGTFDSIDGLWYLYYSYVAVYVGVPGSVGDALLRTWQSWDPSIDQARRQAQTFVTLQQTTAIIQSVNEYRRRVFDKTNYNWDRYIRGRNPVLDPVEPGVVGAGGETLVRDPSGRLFDFEGNQFVRRDGRAARR